MRLTVALMLCLLAVPMVAAGSGGGSPTVVVTDIEGVITRGTLLHVQEAIAFAEDRGAALVLRLNTPGGLVDATLEIHQAIIASEVPVMTYVGPQGAFAASAGTLILLMGHPNGMAPTTTIGSAQPVSVDPSGGSEPAGEKVENFVVEQVRAIAERTGRNVTQAVRFVTENDNLGPEEAVENGVVDVIAPDVRAFIEDVDGRMAIVGEGAVRLDTQGARIIEYERSFLSRFIDIIGNPQIAFLLVLAGTYALVFGLANPGSYAPETIGALLLLLGFVGIGLFSASTAGVILLILALIFFVAEVFTPTHGLLSVAGVIAMIVAVLFLVDEPLLGRDFLRRFYFAGVSAAVLSGGVVFGAVWLAVRARERPIFDVLRGAQGRTIEGVTPHAGRIALHGEIWEARADPALPADTLVHVDRREGLVLWVHPSEASLVAAGTGDAEE